MCIYYTHLYSIKRKKGLKQKIASQNNWLKRNLMVWKWAWSVKLINLIEFLWLFCIYFGSIEYHFHRCKKWSKKKRNNTQALDWIRLFFGFGNRSESLTPLFMYLFIQTCPYISFRFSFFRAQLLTLKCSGFHVISICGYTFVEDQIDFKEIKTWKRSSVVCNFIWCTYGENLMQKRWYKYGE